jgi:DNA-binding beta-propeller fold protein YncE
MEYMKTFLNITLIVFLLSCSKQNGENKDRYSAEQVASLKIDSTKIIRVQTDSIIKIDLNPFLKKNDVNFSEMIKNITFTPLETTDASLVSEINDILVTDSNIYVRDSYQGGSVLIFDKEGKYLKRIERGQGPEEILSLNGIAFDDDQQELVVCHYNFLSFFTSEGKFKRREKIPLSPSYFTVIPGGYLFYSLHGADNRHLGSLIEQQIFITDKQFRLKSTGFPYQYSKENHYESDRYINLFDKNINFTFKFTDTIYQYINDSTVKAKYTIDISDKKIPSQIIKELSSNDFFREAEQNDYYFFSGKYVENKTHDFFILDNFYIKDYTFIFRDKNSGNIRGGTVLINNPEVFPIIRRPVASKGSYFISYFIPEYTDELKKLLPQSSMLLEEDKIKIRNLQEEDNPVLIFYELKPF